MEDVFASDIQDFSPSICRHVSTNIPISQSLKASRIIGSCADIYLFFVISATCRLLIGQPPRTLPPHTLPPRTDMSDYIAYLGSQMSEAATWQAVIGQPPPRGRSGTLLTRY
ncbi:hypothetical protein Tco_0702767 [Tanacetum coccineum]|uniref:Uncharacterized protein n=1 Tax=Tanacetum coccineum TaxID=301880 RepID=A0ABQ4XXH5_9ASTR